MDCDIITQTRLLTDDEVISIRNDFESRSDVIRANSFLELLDKVNQNG